MLRQILPDHSPEAPRWTLQRKDASLLKRELMKEGNVRKLVSDKSEVASCDGPRPGQASAPRRRCLRQRDKSKIVRRQRDLLFRARNPTQAGGSERIHRTYDSILDGEYRSRIAGHEDSRRSAATTQSRNSGLLLDWTVDGFFRQQSDPRHLARADISNTACSCSACSHAPASVLTHRT